MQDKWPHYRFCLTLGLLVVFFMAFLLIRGVLKADTRGEDLTISSIQEVSEKGKAGSDQSILSIGPPQDHTGVEENHPTGNSNGIEETKTELKDIEPLLPPALQLDLRLAGTILTDNNSYAIIIDETTGKQGLYRLGGSIKGAIVLKIDRERVELEKDERIQVLKLTRRSSINASPLAPMIPSIKSIVNETGPVDGDFGGIPVKDLPPFELIVSETGPPVDESIPVKDLPYFEPFANDTGPPVDPGKVYEDLPEFTPFKSERGPQ